MERLTGQAWLRPDWEAAGFLSLWPFSPGARRGGFAPISWVITLRLAEAGELLWVTWRTNSRDGPNHLLFSFQSQAQASFLTFSPCIQASYPGRTLLSLPLESGLAGGKSESNVPGSPRGRAVE